MVPVKIGPSTVVGHLLANSAQYASFVGNLILLNRGSLLIIFEKPGETRLFAVDVWVNTERKDISQRLTNDRRYVISFPRHERI